MSHPLLELLNLYSFTVRRRLFCLGRITREMQHPALADLLAEAQEALRLDRELYELELAWSTRDDRKYSPEASALHRELSHAIAGLDGTLAASQRTFGAGSPQGEAATLLREQIFPRGMKHLTHVSYPDQAASLEALLVILGREPELAEAVRLLNLEDYLQRLTELRARFQAQLMGARGVTFDDLRAARQAGRDRLRRFLFRLGARLFAEDVPEDEAQALQRAIDVILDQNQSIRDHRKRRRNRIADVDPETGELVDEPEAPTPAVAEPPDDLASGATRAG